MTGVKSITLEDIRLREVVFRERCREISNGCWRWTGSIISNGYGCFHIGGRRGSNMLTHRIAWMLHHNRLLASSDLICHTCDNPLCVNPNHLFIGTAQDNVNDMMMKGRHKQQWHGPIVVDNKPLKITATTKTPKATTNRGERCHSAKLTADQVIEMRDRYLNGENSDALSKTYNMSRNSAWSAIRGETWMHLPVPDYSARASSRTKSVCKRGHDLNDPANYQMARDAAPDGVRLYKYCRICTNELRRARRNNVKL